MRYNVCILMMIVSWHLENINLEKKTLCHFFILIACPSGPTICEILAMSQNRIHIVFVKKAKHLQLSVDSICVNLAMCRKKPTNIREWKNQTPWTICEKKTHLLSDSFWILYEHRIFCHLFIFQKNWQCLALYSSQI